MSMCNSAFEYLAEHETSECDEQDVHELLRSLRPLMDEIDVSSDITSDIVKALSAFSNGVICEDTIKIMILKNRKVITLDQTMALTAVI